MSDFILPPDLTDKHSAVNVLLQAIGESPVNSIETSESVDVAAALQTLQEIDNAVQTQGWFFNREYAMQLSPDATAQNILVPRNCLRATKAYDSQGGSGNPVKVAKRGLRLYDPINHTFAWDAPLWVDLTVKLDWVDLPESARAYITIRAAKQFQGRLQTNSLVDRITDEEVVRRMVTLQDEEDEAERHNQLSGNPSAMGKLYGGGVRRRQR